MSLSTLFTDIANAIRNKKGTTDPIVATNFPSEIESIETGGGGVNFNLHVYGSAFQYADDTKVEYSLDGADFVEFNDGQYDTTINLTGSCIILKVQRSYDAADRYTGTNLLFTSSDDQAFYRGYRPESNETIDLNRMLG